MLFECLTGDFLFEPRKGHHYDKDDDHLAQMVELLGPAPRNFALSGKHSRRFFDNTSHLRKIRGLNYWPLNRVLMEKYRYLKEEADLLADFFSKMLCWYPQERSTAQELLEHPWLTMEKKDNVKMSDEAYEEMMKGIKDNEQKKKLKEAFESKLETKINERTFSECGDSDEDATIAKMKMGLESIQMTNIEFLDESSDSLSLGHGDSDCEFENLFSGGGYGKGKALNNSFTGPYENMDHIHEDKGANNQFDQF